MKINSRSGEMCKRARLHCRSHNLVAAGPVGKASYCNVTPANLKIKWVGTRKLNNN